MKKIERKNCCLIEGDDLEHLFTFKKFPVIMGCTDKPVELDLKSDMEWWIGKNSGLIQLKKLLPLDLIYSESHGAGGVGALWNEHHSSFAKFINMFTPTSKVRCILDNDKNKKDRRLYGTNLMVDSPNCLNGIKDPEVVLKAGVYNNEIKNDCLKESEAFK